MLVILFLSKMTNCSRTLGLFPEKIVCERWIAYLHPQKITPKIQCFETYHLQKNNNLVFQIIFTGIALIACAFRYFYKMGEKHSLSTIIIW